MEIIKKSHLFEGEHIKYVEGYPGLYKFIKGKPGFPLIVAVPGGRSTARLFYGIHEGRNEEDFLAHWLIKQGYSFLGISYPLEIKAAVFDKAYPTFSVQDWGKQITQITQTVIKEHHLEKDFILCGWSMGGKTALPVAKFAPDFDLNLLAFIALAATPAIPGLTSWREIGNIKRPNGYWATVEDFPRETGQIKENALLNGVEDIIPKEILLEYYLGHNPIGLLATGYRYKDGEFYRDVNEDIEDNMAEEFAEYPLLATIYPSETSDARHALTDSYTWAMVLVNRIYFYYFNKMGYIPQNLPKEKWQQLNNLLENIATRLSQKIPQGNHCFFIGKKGAKATALAIHTLIQELNKLQLELNQIFEKNPS